MLRLPVFAIAVMPHPTDGESSGADTMSGMDEPGGVVEVLHFDVFAEEAGGGNPCRVVMDAAALSPVQMRSIAAHYGQESCFVLDCDAAGPRSLKLRFFVPRQELAMCVHATIAAVTALVAAGRVEGGHARLETASGPCQVSWEEGAAFQVTVQQQTPRLGPAVDLHRQLERALRLQTGAVDEGLPIRWASVSRAKLIVPCRRAGDVNAADPDLEALWRICLDQETTGAYVFAPHPDGRPGHVVARQFPVDAGYPEDPATGVAAAALAVYLACQARPTSPTWLQVDIDQGQAMGRPSRLHARALADAAGVQRSTVRGPAVLRGRERLDLAALPHTSDGLADGLTANVR